jgi:prepilin-type N-terminal cleavage/methylation domain-containing protein
MPRLPASQRAYTLIEVMIAATILLVSFSAVITAVTRGADMIDSARKQQIAQQIIEGEIAFQRNSTWLWSPGLVGIQEMVNSSYSLTVNATGTNVIDNTTNGRDDRDYFILDSNLGLLNQAKGFTCEAQALGIRGSPTMIAITWTVSWTTANGRTQSLIGTTQFARDGLHLTYQK